jgi:hypothetical protein
MAHRLLWVLAALVIAQPHPLSAQTPPMTIRLTPQIGLGTLEQAPEAADAAFEALTLSHFAPVKPPATTVGDLMLLRKDRGPHPGRYAIFVTAGHGDSSYIASVARTFPTVKSYQLIGVVSAGPLPTVDLLAVHYIKVQPAKAAAFDRFIADKLNPAVANLRPDLRFLYYKSQDGGYITIVGITKASRDKYWPGGADSDDLKAAFTPAVRSLASELQAFLVDGSWGTGMTAQVYEAKDWADWTILR